MAKEKINYKTMDIASLSFMEKDLRERLREMRFNRVTGSNFKSMEYQKAKKELACVLTFLTFHKKGISLIGGKDE